ncbi:MAG: flagellar basal body L-ring protein, partial [Deinococcus-Thermus bacterium]|nr:flagellar basal body L-ring protein [Deinococcota bacterium]
MRAGFFCLVAALLLTGCGRTDHLGRPPSFSPNTGTSEQRAMSVAPLPARAQATSPTARASLWSGGRESLLGDRRASRPGDILTVVIEIDESAELRNSTERSRGGSENLEIPQLLGLPQRAGEALPDGAGLDEAVSLNSRSRSEGDGSVRRSEELTLRVAATVVDVLRNDVLRIQGSQEVRVNFEMRELLVSGYVRPEDIS